MTQQKKVLIQAQNRFSMPQISPKRFRLIVARVKRNERDKNSNFFHRATAQKDEKDRLRLLDFIKKKRRKERMK
jgi:hypothetical protein